MANLFDDVPEAEPLSFRAGDSVIWRKPCLAADYAPDEYRLDYVAVLETNAATQFDATATAVDGVFEINITPATSGNFTAGLYHWSASITRLSDNAKRTIEQGRFRVDPDFAAATGDQRSHAERMLDQLESLIEGRAKSDAAAYEIDGRKITKLAPGELMEWRDYYRKQVGRGKAKRAGKIGRQIIKPRFK